MAEIADYYVIRGETLEKIANAIRKKTGGTATVKLTAKVGYSSQYIKVVYFDADGSKQTLEYSNTDAVNETITVNIAYPILAFPYSNSTSYDPTYTLIDNATEEEIAPLSYNEINNNLYNNVCYGLLEKDKTYSLNIQIIYVCFIAGTQVAYNLNGDTKAIEEFTVGDNVVSYDIKTGENYIAKVTKLRIGEGITKLVKIGFANGITITMTPEHPIYCEDGFKSLTGYMGFEKLQIGDTAKTYDGWSLVTSIDYFTTEPTTVYTLSIKDENEEIDEDINDTFYANGICVHNKPSLS